MGLIRLLFLVGILWLIWFMLRNWMRKVERRAAAHAAERLAPGKIVRCHHCDLHLPEAQAIAVGDLWFCSAAHKLAWLNQSGDSH